MGKNKEIWDIDVKSYDCPNHYIDDGYMYCAHKEGSQFCSKADCPIKSIKESQNG